MSTKRPAGGDALQRSDVKNIARYTPLSDIISTEEVFAELAHGSG